RQHPELAEHEGDRALGAHVAAELAEGVAHVGDSAHAVVGEAVHDHGDAAGGVTLVAHLLVLDALELAGGLLDRALDHVLRHVGRQALVGGAAQARVAGRVAAAGPGRDGDLADELGEDLAAARVLGVLARVDGAAQRRFGGRVAAAGPGRDGGLADDRGEELAAARVVGVLARVDGRTSTHGNTAWNVGKGRDSNLSRSGPRAGRRRPGRRR